MKTIQNYKNAIENFFNSSKYSENVQKKEVLYKLIASSNRDRWLIPHSGTNIFQLNWQPGNFSSKIAWFLIKICASIKITSFLPFRSMKIRLPINVSGNFPWGKFLPFIYIGTPGPYQKIILYFLNASDDSYVVKIPLEDLSFKSIQNEETMLNLLAQRNLNAPKPIEAFKPFFFQEYKKLKQDDGTLTENKISYLLQLVNNHQQSISSLFKINISPYLERLNFESSKLNQFVLNYADFKIQSVIVHGDFAPWNLLTNKNEICPIDWEQGSIEGFPSYDLIHYLLKPYLLNNHSLPQDQKLQCIQHVLYSKNLDIYFEKLRISPALQKPIAQLSVIQLLAFITSTETSDIKGSYLSLLNAYAQKQL